MHKRHATGGKQKRKYELGRQPANTKLDPKNSVRRIRFLCGNVKWGALRLQTGNYSWGSEAITRKTRIEDVVDPAPFKQWYLTQYGVELGKKKKGAAAKEETEEGETAAQETKKSNHVQKVG
ncbi:hypothetical protein ACS0TY_022595 [Phlomoides rotata]